MAVVAIDHDAQNELLVQGEEDDAANWRLWKHLFFNSFSAIYWGTTFSLDCPQSCPILVSQPRKAWIHTSHSGVGLSFLPLICIPSTTILVNHHCCGGLIFCATLACHDKRYIYHSPQPWCAINTTCRKHGYQTWCHLCVSMHLVLVFDILLSLTSPKRCAGGMSI